ncbi:unnamed protein product [Musa hybrid cultivar]
MHLLEVRLGAVVSRLYSLCGSAWACLALVAAAATALGLWAVRVAGSKFIHPPTPTSPVPEVGSASVVNSAAAEAAIIAKARFTAYYSAAAAGSFHIEDDDVDEEEEVEDEYVSNVGLRVRAPRDGGWDMEWIAVMTREDLGWHRYLDMTVLNGSVVKLRDARHGRLTATHGGCLRRRSAGGV